MVRKSTRGGGLHLYIFFSDTPSPNHTVHADLAQRALKKMSEDTGFDFSAPLDVSGGVMWIWHRDATPENGGLSLD